MFIKRLNGTNERQRGDTLIEVLIAVTIVSMVLGGAYVTTNRSLLATRGAQERAAALKLTESQVEQLKGLVTTDPDSVLNAAGQFCIYQQTTVVTNVNDPRCTQTAAGQIASADPRYAIAITRTNNTFDVKTTWANVNGKQTDQLNLRYRVYR